MGNYQHFVAGFLFDEDRRVALVLKTRPDWQKGRLNAIGGKVDPGETAVEAMRREFKEEADLDLDGWEYFTKLVLSYGEVDFFRLFVAGEVLDQIKTMTDEQVGIFSCDDLPANILPNLNWLIPLASYTHDVYEPVVFKEL